MKILITAPSLDENENVSGISTVVRQIIQRADANFYHFQAGRRDGERKGSEWFFEQMNLTPRFLRSLRREKIDLVHLNTALNPASIVRDFALALATRVANRPLLLHLHGGRFLMEDFKNHALSLMTETMLRLADRIVILSEHERESITKRWRNLKIEILPNAVSIDQIPDLAREPQNAVKIIFLGRLSESKGLFEIVEAFRALRSEDCEFRFECYGAGELKDFFIEEMTEILGDKFYFGGVISGAEKWEKLAASDVFLLPSRHGEGLPMAMLEAMAAGCVVVAADVASIRSVIKDGENAFLVEPYDAAQIVEKLNFLIAGKPVWNKLRRNARATIEEKFAIEDYVKNLEKLYSEIAALPRKS